MFRVFKQWRLRLLRRRIIMKILSHENCCNIHPDWFVDVAQRLVNYMEYGTEEAIYSESSEEQQHK